MSTIPSRAESFAQVMMCLGSQEPKPDLVYVTLDCWSESNPGPVFPSYSPDHITIRNRTEERGTDFRWRPLWFPQISNDDIVSVVDDDWFFDPFYLKTSRDHLLRLNGSGRGCVVGWMGWISPVHMAAASVRYDCDIPLAYAAGGLITGFVSDLRAGLGRAPKEIWADDIRLNVGLDDCGIRRVRPRGWSHAVELPSHRDPSSIQMAHREKMLGEIKDLFVKYGVNAL